MGFTDWLVTPGLVEAANRWLGHLESRHFSAATVRGYTFDVVCLARFLDDAGISWRDLAPSDGGRHPTGTRQR